MVSWASADDVRDVTDTSVSQQVLLRANADVEAVAFSDRKLPTATSDVSADDAERLRRAVAHQATMLASNPSASSLPDAESVRLGDASITRRSGASAASTVKVLLASAAAQIIGSLSWKGAVAVGRFPAAHDYGSLWGDT